MSIPTDPEAASGEMVQALEPPAVPLPIVNGTLTSEYPSVGIVNDGCTGTLVAPRHVLTAAHCTEGLPNTRGKIQLGDATVGSVELIEHPQYNSFSLANDIAIMVLAREVPDITPSNILRARPVVGEMLTLVGYGDGGTTYNPLHDFPTKRIGYTPLESITSNQIRWTFHGDGESNTAPGDSGGPSFVERDGELLVAGITSGGDGDPWNRNGQIDESWNTRVDVFARWIDTILAGEVPEPEPDEHGDEPRLGATKIALSDGGGWESGALQDTGDRDAFQLRVSSRVRTAFTAVSTDGGFDTFLRLYDSAGRSLQSNDDVVSGINTNSRIIRTLEPGTYFVTVGAFEDDGVGVYSLVVNFGTEAGGDQHANDPNESPTGLALDLDGHTALTGRLETVRDRDVFEFTLDRPTPAILSAVSTSSDLDSYLWLYDASGAEIADNDDGPVLFDSQIEIELEAGTYFASVGSLDAYTLGTYVFSLQVKPTEVNLFALPEKVGLRANGAALASGQLVERDDFHTYTFVATATGRMTAATRTRGFHPDTRIAVYDAQRNELSAANDNSVNDHNSTVEFSVFKNQRYYVVVAGEAGTTGEYWLTLKTSPGLDQKAIGQDTLAAPGRSKAVDKTARKAPPAATTAKPPEPLTKKSPDQDMGRAAREALFAAWRLAAKSDGMDLSLKHAGNPTR
jgi:hypothetical protein